MTGVELSGLDPNDEIRNFMDDEERDTYTDRIYFALREMVTLFNDLCFSQPVQFRFSGNGLIGTIFRAGPDFEYDIRIALLDSDSDITIDYDTKTGTIVSFYIHQGIYKPDIKSSDIDQLDTKGLALYSHSIQAFLDTFVEYTKIRRDLRAEIMIWRDKLANIIGKSRMDLYYTDEAFEFPFSEELADRLMRMIYDAFDSSYQEILNPFISRYDELFYANLKTYLEYEFERIIITPKYLLLFTLHSIKASIYTSSRN